MIDLMTSLHQALNYLRSWLSQHPDYQSIPVEFDAQPEEGFYTLHKKVTAMFRKAADVCPHDADLFTVLGVLYNLSREYDLAIESFKQAIVLDPKNYSLWNKLGATQANSPRPQGSKEAVYAYRKALELKPNYVRAWVNMGISYANQGIYDTASKYYLRALRYCDTSSSFHLQSLRILVIVITHIIYPLLPS